jgi:CMP-N-acetylneuraminic acid synthetase
MIGMKKSNSNIKVVALIMARSASTRCPNKLLRKFGNTTIIDIALNKLNKMDFVDERILAVAEDVFIEKLKEYPNVNLYKRTMESVSKGHPPLKVRYEHYYKINADYVMFFNPCHPFVRLDTLKDAVNIVREKHCNSFTSVIPSNEWVFDVNGNPVTHNDPKITATNQGTVRTKVAHAFHIFRPEYFRMNDVLWSFAKDDPALIPISEEEALDIDTELEFTLSELLYCKKMQSGEL